MIMERLRSVHRLFSALLLLLLLLDVASAQLLANGDSTFPSCAATCTLLNQAAQACGGTATTSPSIWSCFCQSAYLTSLYKSPTGICDAFCTDPSDNQQVMTWYTSNCGTDDGASEHAAGAGGTTTVVITSTSTTATPTLSTGGGAALPSTTTSGGTLASGDTSTPGGRWWNTHYKWVIMLIVLFVGLIIFALLAIWLKRRHDRKQDRIRDGFNAGITDRTVPTTAPDTSHVGDSHLVAAGGMAPVGGRDSPARTRDAFMPYGYGYTRSESRLASHATGLEGRRSPLPRGGTPVGDLEKAADVGTAETPDSAPGRRQKRILVRERDTAGLDGSETEKM